MPRTELYIEREIHNLKGQLHNETGPAIIWNDGLQEWWYNGERIYCSSQEEFERKIKLKVFW
jgi:hypothetical protein